RPDLVIWGYVTNDANEGIVPQFNYEKLEKDAVVAFHKRRSEHGLLQRLDFQLQQLRREKLLAKRAGPKHGYEYNEWELRLVEDAANRAAYAKTLAELATTMRAAGTPYFFLSLPNSPREEVFRPRYAPNCILLRMPCWAAPNEEPL
ncbi:MAG: hypothetical protein ABJA94_10380, partial [Rhodoglobus sp.]